MPRDEIPGDEPEILPPERKGDARSRVETVFKDVDAEIVFDNPTAKGDLARAANFDARAPDAGQRDPGAPAFGFDAAPGQFARGFRGVAGDVAGDAMDAISRLTAGMAGVRDQISDAEAVAIAARRRRQSTARVDVEVDVQVPTLIQIGADRDPPPPQNLPAVLNRAVVFRDPNWKFRPPPMVPVWGRIYDLPGFYANQIRALGRFVFDQFPCFAAQKEMATRTDDDPLGAIRILVNFGGAGPNAQGELDTMASWIKANGVAVQATEMEFDHLQGYRPKVVLACDAQNSYLLVVEKRAEGAPADSMYIYSWRGGFDFYRDVKAIENLNRALDRNPDPARLMRKLPGRGGALARMERHPAPRAPAPRMASRLAPVRPPEPRVDVDALRLAPAIAPVRRVSSARSTGPSDVLGSDLTSGLRARGFRMQGDVEGQFMRKTLEDGRSAVIRGDRNVPLARSSTIRLYILDEVGNVCSDDIVGGIDDIEAALMSDNIPGPR